MIKTMQHKATQPSAKPPYNVHLGAGPNIIPGWLNYDIDTKWGATHHDLSRGIPLAGTSVAKIYSEHFIEHFDKKAGYKLLQDCFRVLTPGGTLRIGWPDMNRLIWSHLTHSRAHKRHILPHLKLRFGHWDEITADRLFSWDHRYAYTARHLHDILADIGFINIKRHRFGQSDYDFDYDTHNDPVTVYLEAVKPPV